MFDISDIAEEHIDEPAARQDPHRAIPRSL
jgi:hypothetical protein